MVKAMNADTYLDDVRDTMNDKEVNVESTERPKSTPSTEDSLAQKANKGPSFAKKDKKKSQTEIDTDQFESQEVNVSDSFGQVRRSSNMSIEEEPEIDV